MPTDYRLPLDNTQDRVRYFQDRTSALLQAPGFPGQLAIAQDGAIMIATGENVGNLRDLAQSLWPTSQQTLTFSALAGGAQPTTTNVVSTLYTKLTTVASGNDSVGLPAATGSLALYMIWNSTSTSAQVFGAGTDTINAIASGTGVACAGGKGRLFIDIGSGKWLSWLSA